MESVEANVDVRREIAKPIAHGNTDLYEFMHMAIIEPWQRRPDWDLFAQVGEEIGHHPKRPGDRPR